MNLTNLQQNFDELSAHTDLHSYFTVHPVTTIAETDAHKECDRLFEEMAEALLSSSTDQSNQIIIKYLPLIEALSSNVMCNFHVFANIDRARLAMPTSPANALLHILNARFNAHLGISFEAVGITVLSNN